MDYFNYKDNALYAEDCSISDIAAKYGTPLYVYSKATFERHWRAFNDGLSDYPHLICYAVKANSNLAVLQTMAKLGSGFDIVSIGELERVLVAGGDANKIVFSGVGKRVDEIERALDVGILCFNVESRNELKRIENIANAKNVTAPISIRVNPDVDAKTHPYISTGLKENKFGVTIDEAISMYQYASTSSSLNIVGIDCHIGSQLTSLPPFMEALDRLLVLIESLKQKDITIHHLNLGGGIGVCYKDETPPHPKEYSAALIKRLKHYDMKIILEPGRAIAANAGVLITKIEHIKQHHDKSFAIVDAAMNDNLRPAMYQAHHDIIPVSVTAATKPVEYDIVGPICETGDFLGKDRMLAISEGDLLCMRSSGAYCFSMSSNYNSRPRAAEVLVAGKTAHLVRRRESIESIYAGEKIIENN